MYLSEGTFLFRDLINIIIINLKHYSKRFLNVEEQPSGKFGGSAFYAIVTMTVYYYTILNIDREFIQQNYINDKEAFQLPSQ